MITLTKEWIQQTIAELEEERDAVPGVVNEDAANALAAMKLALASLEAKPVAWTTGRYSQNIGYKFGEKEPDEAPCIMSIYWDFDTFRAHTDCDATALRWLEEAIKNTGAKPLYTAPPAPVSVPDRVTYAQSEKLGCWDGWESCSEAWADGWNACRDAMLQGADGNTPVIPDGWVMLPAEPTQAMMNAWLSEVANWRGHAAGYRAMIAAAPQQEVTQALSKGMERYGDVMQELAKKEVK